MKRAIIAIGIVLMGLMAMAQTSPPDVVTQWIVNTPTQLPAGPTGFLKIYQVSNINLTRYKYHYFYVFLQSYGSGTCAWTDLQATTSGEVYAGIPISGSSYAYSEIGGSVNMYPGTSPVWTIRLKGNGYFNFVEAVIFYEPANNATGLHNCAVTVLYRGSTEDEDGLVPVGNQVPMVYGCSTVGRLVGNVVTSGTMSTGTYDFGNCPLGPNSMLGVGEFNFCVNPIATTGAYRGTGPVMARIYMKPPQTALANYITELGTYSVTNSCMVIPMPVNTLPVLTPQGPSGSTGRGNLIYVDFTWPAAISYPTMQQEIMMIAIGRPM